MSALISVLSLPSLETCNIDGVEGLWTDFSCIPSHPPQSDIVPQGDTLDSEYPHSFGSRRETPARGCKNRDMYNIKALYVVMKDFVDFSWLQEASISTHTGRSLDSYQTRH
jgi:hypothetical protein